MATAFLRLEKDAAQPRRMCWNQCRLPPKCYFQALFFDLMSFFHILSLEIAERQQTTSIPARAVCRSAFHRNNTT
ncbi:hypothetical protein Y032_0394g626 [Ancylostoma ceylanicum]|uniref:Uncharacterized protein n=1 Tax=Ancylostoma ceylanicum TaxID=53326 RepID=A0A016RRV6_9BILA|nr:hypothetical protein Y032_0394g626 [Ancylostoma ceylanicum]